MVDALERAREIAQHRQDLGAGAQDLAGRDRPRARQVMVDQAAHLGDLAADQGGERAVAALGLVVQDRERRLEAVGEVADVGPGALDQGLAVVEQGVQLERQRLELGRQPALEPARAAGADRGERRLDPPERRERDPDLEQERAQEPEKEAAQRQRQQAVEAPLLGGHLGAVAGDREQAAAPAASGSVIRRTSMRSDWPSGPVTSPTQGPVQGPVSRRWDPSRAGRRAPAAPAGSGPRARTSGRADGRGRRSASTSPRAAG